MADEVERLATAPFREIIEKGRTAIENAPHADEETSPLMVKVAQSLVREGERALKRIEPLCTKNYEDYGVNFVDAMKENDEIAQYRSELENLLWDFDEYVEPGEFDPAKFEELQKASRWAAPKIVDILKRMKLVAPAPTSAQSSRAASTAADRSSNSHHEQNQNQTSIIVDPPAPSPTEKLMAETEQLSKMMGALAGPDEGLEANLPPLSTSDQDRARSRHSDVSNMTSELPPRPPSTDPWQLGAVPPVSPVDHPGEADRWERRPLVPSDSPTIPQVQPASPFGMPVHPLRIRSRADDPPHQVQRDDDDRQMRAASRSLGTASDGSRSPGKSNRWTNSTQGSIPRSYPGFASASRSPPSNEGIGWSGPIHDPSTSRSPSDTSSVIGHTPSIPENTAVVSPPPQTSLPSIPNFPPRQTSLAKQASIRHSSRHPSTESINSSVFDVVDCMSATSPINPTAKRNSLPFAEPTSPVPQQAPEYSVHLPPYPRPGTETNRSSGAATFTNYSTSTLTARLASPTPHFHQAVDEGLIPVDTEHPMPEEPAPAPAREPDCTISPSSSFYKLKGFCRGAEEVMQGRLGFKKIKRPVGGFSMAVVAKCNHCLFEIDFKQVEQDLHNDSSGSFTSNTIGFRLRILQKSHLQIRHVEEQLYGCLFCIQEGRTTEESDATVFFNQSQLFAHMARHPRPLPRVPGITVVETAEIPPAFQDNFDLHFGQQPAPSVMAGLARELARLPAGVATETRKIQNGVLRSPPGRDTALHFAVGARIVGIEFPAKYDGKWGIGWHDGVRAAFEADSVLVDPPPKLEIKMQGTSNTQAVARWKWSLKGDEKWLKFDKGDVIKNIGWAYREHWCWSGTTSKGWGIFPQSHLDPNSIRTVQPGDGASVSSAEKKGPLWFPLSSLRKNADRRLAPFAAVAPADPSPVPSRAGVY
ncbi:hypothetical protein GGS23DRAFT_593507 [Durotheca rogersii]|uniref:uncharacterized protein n=1 Tax=Durotheca rogersii TaxID=419775 RepID=UPI00221FB425|nr:uncharacterized protein GGS23DRAFT_593507 [Durotheca rogersii]KAI5866771.1 hypothetical protein GGS23DRAFT_593507 [Durotheca rogersii]